MAQYEPFDLVRMFLGEDWHVLFWAEVACRTAVMYLFMLVMTRFIGKRGVGQITPFEFLIVVVLGSATGDPMFYPHVPLLHGMIVITVVVLLQRLFARVTNRSQALHHALETRPVLLIADGRINAGGLGRQSLSRKELMMVLRMQGVEDVGAVRRAYFEPSGAVSIFQYPPERRREVESTLPDDATG
ncbi:MAG: DUF421 domain-containing protein [Pseudomonadota bacterium]|nr:DUF421 domain-containing protein [Pseudomonadota bacterium]